MFWAHLLLISQSFIGFGPKIGLSHKFEWLPRSQAWAGWSIIAHQLNTLFPGPFQGPHIKEDEVNDVKLKLMKLLKGYLSFLAPFCPSYKKESNV